MIGLFVVMAYLFIGEALDFHDVAGGADAGRNDILCAWAALACLCAAVVALIADAILERR